MVNESKISSIRPRENSIREKMLVTLIYIIRLEILFISPALNHSDFRGRAYGLRKSLKGIKCFIPVFVVKLGKLNWATIKLEDAWQCALSPK